MKMKKLIQDGQGFKDIFFSQGWRLACSDYCGVKNGLESFQSFEKHLNTEEAFILLKGDAYIVTAGKKKKPEKFSVRKMCLGQIYIIEKEEWHLSIFAKDTLVLIVENDIDSPSVSFILDSQCRNKIRSRVVLK